MISTRPRLTKVECGFTLSMALSLSVLVLAIVVRWVIFLDTTEGPARDLIAFLLQAWVASVVVAAVIGSAALVAGRRLLTVVPFLGVGYYLAVLGLLVTTPYSNIQTIPQLIGVEAAIYLGMYLFWLVLLKVPLPRLGQREGPQADL